MQIVNVSLREYIYIYICQLNIAQMSSECSIEKLERNIRSDKSTQDLAWRIYYYLAYKERSMHHLPKSRPKNHYRSKQENR